MAFDTVLNTLRALVTQQDQLAAAQGSVATSLVEVYRALGGGWEVRNNASPVSLLPASTVEEMRERSGIWRRVLKNDVEEKQ